MWLRTHRVRRRQGPGPAPLRRRADLPRRRHRLPPRQARARADRLINVLGADHHGYVARHERGARGARRRPRPLRGADHAARPRRRGRRARADVEAQGRVRDPRRADRRHRRRRGALLHGPAQPRHDRSTSTSTWRGGSRRTTPSTTSSTRTPGSRASCARPGDDAASSGARRAAEAALDAAAEPAERELVKRLLELPDEVARGRRAARPAPALRLRDRDRGRLPRLLPRLPGRRRRGRGGRGRRGSPLCVATKRVIAAHARPARSRRAGEHVVAGGRTLVLGATGFAGRHFVDAAAAAGLEVVSAAREPGAADVSCDLLDAGLDPRPRSRSRGPTPSSTSPARRRSRESWADPGATFAGNATGHAQPARGGVGAGARAPACSASPPARSTAPCPTSRSCRSPRTAPLRPLNPYAESKAAMELRLRRSSATRGPRDRGRPRLQPHRARASPTRSRPRASRARSRPPRPRGATQVDAARRATCARARLQRRARRRPRLRAAVERGLAGTFNVCSGAGRADRDAGRRARRARRRRSRVRSTTTRLRPAEAPR